MDKKNWASFCFFIVFVTLTAGYIFCNVAGIHILLVYINDNTMEEEIMEV